MKEDLEQTKIDISELIVKDCNCGKNAHDELIRKMDDNTKPFIETIISEGEVIRRFDPSYPEHLFKWHWDAEDRTIEVLEDSDWRFQYDNEMPIPMLTGVDINIPAGTIHRVIKGTTALSVKILLD